MADGIYNITKFGKTTKYRKVGKDYFRLKSDGTLAKAKASGLTLANLKNSKSSPLVKESQNMTDGGKSKLKKQMKSLNIIKKDANLAVTKKDNKTNNKKKDVSQGSTAGGNTLTFGKAFRAAKDAGKKEFTYRGKRYNTRTKDEDKKASNKKVMKVDSFKKSNVSANKNKKAGIDSASGDNNKVKQRKTDNMEGGTAPLKKKSKGFLDRVKDDLKKAVKETKRNFSDKRYFVNGVDSRKEKIKSKSNIKQKK